MFTYLNKNYSIAISAREILKQNNLGPHKGSIGSVGRTFWIDSSVGEFLCRNGPRNSLFIIQSSVFPSTCKVSYKNDFRGPPGSAEFLDFVIKRRSANHSWRPSSKAAPVSRYLVADDSKAIGAHKPNKKDTNSQGDGTVVRDNFMGHQLKKPLLHWWPHFFLRVGIEGIYSCCKSLDPLQVVNFGY